MSFLISLFIFSKFWWCTNVYGTLIDYYPSIHQSINYIFVIWKADKKVKFHFVMEIQLLWFNFFTRNLKCKLSPYNSIFKINLCWCSFLLFLFIIVSTVLRFTFYVLSCSLKTHPTSIIIMEMFHKFVVTAKDWRWQRKIHAIQIYLTWIT